MKPEVSPKNGTRRYAVFLSYRHADNKEPGRQWATWLHQMLENYEIPSALVGTPNSRGDPIPASMYPVFRDEEELPADAELSAPINTALRNSEHLVVICSPAAVESRFVSDEIRTFKRLGKADRILALIIRGEPGVTDGPAKYATDFTTADECFPEVLRRQLDQNGEITDQVTQPIAADFRISCAEEGWTTPQAYRDHLERIGGIPKKELRTRVAKYAERCALMKLKLIAGVLGVPLGELTRRDQASQLKRARRRQRLIIWVAASLAFLLCLAVGGGVIAIIKQREARSALKEQRRLSFEAVVRNAEADDEDGESEKVVAALESYLAEPELAGHPRRARAVNLIEKARDGYKRFAAFAVRLRKGDHELTLDLGNRVMLELVLIPAGTFTMGSAPNEGNPSVTLASPEEENDRSDNEIQHSVIITRPFYMGKFHVTQEQYELVAQKTPSYFKGKPQNPVEQVTWYDAVAFCEKLRKQSGSATVRFTLPTEAQWEYACRAGSQTRFYFGDDEKELVDYAWFKTNAGPGVAGYGTHPIGEKNKPNGYGLHDMHGNVFNWCQDWYGKRYYSTSPINDPKGPVEGEIVKSLNSVARVMRGGSWSHLAEYCRSGHRDHDAPGDRYSDLGFRVVIAYPDQ